MADDRIRNQQGGSQGQKSPGRNPQDERMGQRQTGGHEGHSEQSGYGQNHPEHGKQGFDKNRFKRGQDR